MGVFQAADGTLTYKHKCGEGVSALAAFDPAAGMSALLLVGYEVCVRVCQCISCFFGVCAFFFFFVSCVYFLLCFLCLALCSFPMC